MLAKSPPIPLVIDYLDIDRGHILSAKDEEGILLALKQPNRIRCIRVGSDPLESQKFVMAMNDKFPILEYLVMAGGTDDATFVFLKIIQAPHLRHLVLNGVAPPIRSPLITTAMGLVTLCLVIHDPSSYFNSNTLLQWVSPLSQLETLEITVTCHMEMQLSHMPIITYTTLPNLRLLSLKGVSAHVEVLIHQIATPRLERLHISFYDEHLTVSIPCLVLVMNTTENKKVRFDSAKFEFFVSQVRVLAPELCPLGDFFQY